MSRGLINFAMKVLEANRIPFVSGMQMETFNFLSESRLGVTSPFGSPTMTMSMERPHFYARAGAIPGQGCFTTAI